MKTTHTNIIENCPDCDCLAMIVAYRENGQAAYVKCINRECPCKKKKEWEISAWNIRARKANAPI